jgi:hypothetical protein
MTSLYILLMIALSAVLPTTADVALSGLVYGTNGLPMKEVNIALIQDGVETAQVRTSPNGAFAFELSFDHVYELRFNRPGHEPRYLVFDTRHLSDEDKAYTYTYNAFRVTMYEGSDQQDPTLVTSVRFDANSGGFTHD